MGSGIAKLSWLPDNVDEETCYELAKEMDASFDEEAFFLLADRKGEIHKDVIMHWTEPLDSEEKPFFKEQLACASRLEFLKKFKPFISHKRLGHGVRLKAELRALKLTDQMIKKHREVPDWASA
jgi:hypothetical protein